MKAKSTQTDVDEYIAGFPREIATILQKIRLTLRRAAPGAEETISYRIPTFKLQGRPLIYFAAFKRHIGLYPMTASVKQKFRKELSGYEGSTGTVRLPLDEPVPYALIGRIVKFLIGENSVRTTKAKRQRSRNANT